MEFGGNPILEIFPVSDPLVVYELFCQIIHAWNYLECYKIEHNDIKPGNILVDKIADHLVIKFIDFDIGFNESITIKTNKGSGYKGHTHIYASPEVITFATENITNSATINPWKS